MKKLVLILSLFLCSVTEAKFINFSFNPFGATVGLNSYALDLKLAKKLTIGVTYTDIDYNEFLSVSQTGEMLGGRIMIYFNEALADSWWLRLEGGNLDTNLVVKDIFSQAITATGTAEGSYYSAMLGYMWMWSVFNISWGIGVVSYDADIVVTSGSINESQTLNGSTFAGDLSIGLAF